MDFLETPAKFRINFQVSGDTDIGGGKENQDDFLIWQKKEEKIYVLAVLDGHGRDVGKLAAESGKNYLLQYFDQNYKLISSNPVEVISNAMKLCHLHIKEKFRTELSSQGWEVLEAVEGYLIKRKNPTQSWMCVHGGTSCSIIAVIDDKLYTANVGDSSALLCTSDKLLNSSNIIHLGDLDQFSDSNFDPCIDEDLLKDTLLITSEHSPESYREFNRMRNFRSNESDKRFPALHVVYDSPGVEKIKCPPVFIISSDDKVSITNKGTYYKNVRKEWASLVTTPSSARFQDALAFTRSLGDLHLQTYGNIL